MTAFEDFVNLELPKRPVMTKGAIDATGDPNVSILPQVTGAPIGTFYLQDDVTPRQLWQRIEPPPSGTWSPVTGAIPAPNQYHVDINSVETYENGSELFPFKTMLEPLENWGRPVSLDDALITKYLIVNSGTYTDALTIYASRRINIKINGVVIINSITMEIDGNNDFAAGSVLTIDETSAIFMKVLSAAAILISLTFNEINPSTNAVSASLSFKSLMCGQISCSVTNPVFANFERCRITNVVGSIRFDVIKTTILHGAWSIISASIYNSGVDSENYPVLWAADITASESLRIRETWNPSGLVLTTPDLQIDRFSYDAGIEDGSLAIGTPGSTTMIDPPQPDGRLHVDATYTGDYSDGTLAYPFATEALARAADADAVIVLKGYVENADVDTGTETVDEFPDTVGKGVTWEVVISKGAAIEHVTARTVWDAATNVIATLVTDTAVFVGTIDVTLSCDLVADQVRLRATATSDDWSVKVIERVIS